LHSKTISQDHVKNHRITENILVLSGIMIAVDETNKCPFMHARSYWRPGLGVFETTRSGQFVPKTAA